MTVEQFAREGLRAWRAQGVPVDSERAERCRDETVRAIEKAVRASSEKRRRRQRSRAFVAGFALAAASVMVLGGWLLERAVRTRSATTAQLGTQPDPALLLRGVHGMVVADRAGKAQVVATGGALDLGAGDAVSTLKDATARLILPASGEVHMGSVTDLKIHENRLSAQRLKMGAGHIEVDLPKQDPARSLVVSTPHAEVAVIGTMFSVDVCHPAMTGSTVTEVRVKRGVVRVTRNGQGGTLVSRGEAWSSNGMTVPFDSAPCSSSLPAPSPAEAEAAPALTPLRASPHASPRKRDLAEQNRLYQAALDARNGRDEARSVALLGEFLAKYPDSPLREEAQVERLRALKRLGDHAQAARNARRYLAEHASGFARDEAQELIWGPDASASGTSAPGDSSP